VLVAYSEAKRKHCLIVKPASRWLPALPAGLHGPSRPLLTCGVMLCSPKAQLIRIDPSSGSLTWHETVGRDTFDDEVCTRTAWHCNSISHCTPAAASKHAASHAVVYHADRASAGQSIHW
jgi:hypothetical protein